METQGGNNTRYTVTKYIKIKSGDTSSFSCVYSDEAVEEVKKFNQSKKAYVDATGKFVMSTAIDTVNYVCYNLSE